MSEAASPSEQRTVMLSPTRVRQAEYERNDWVANVEFGTAIEDILNPAYWAHVASKMRPYDHIEARADDGTWIAYLIVTGSDRTWARVAVDRVVKLTARDVSQSQAQAQHVIEWKGPHNKFTVIRLADREPIRTGFSTKDEATAWMREHERMLGASVA